MAANSLWEGVLYSSMMGFAGIAGTVDVEIVVNRDRSCVAAGKAHTSLAGIDWDPCCRSKGSFLKW